jgi:long-chain fatty acid transport protein
MHPAPFPAAAASLGLVMAAALAAADAAGQGFALNEHGTCAMGRGGAGVAAPCGDGSALFLSPAGLAGMDGWTVSGGVTLVAASGSFTDDLTGESTDLDNPMIPVPHAYAVREIGDRFVAGVGLAVPYGLETRWPTDFQGRFIGYDNSIRATYIQPTVAVEVTRRISVGAGVDLVVGSAELARRLDLALQGFFAPGLGPFRAGELGIPRGTDIADVRLTASGATSLAANFGVRVQATDRLALAARYLTRTTLDFEGDAGFERIFTGLVLPPQNPISLALGLDPDSPLSVDALLGGLGLFMEGGSLTDQPARTSVTMPDQLTLGAAFRARPDLQLLLDWQWINWSLFDVVRIEFENPATPAVELVQQFEDTHGIRLGVDWRATERWSVRGGYIRHGGAEPPGRVTPLLPEGARTEVTAGVGVRLIDAVEANLAYMFLRQDARRGRVHPTLPGVEPAPEMNSGLFEFRAHLLAATLTARF